MLEDSSLPTPLAMWNTVRGVWELPIRNIICEHSVLFSEVWPTSGTMRNGLVFVRPTLVRLTDGNVSSSLPIPLLPTNRAQNGENRNSKIWLRAAGKPQNLENALAHVISSWDIPEASMLRTPTATEGERGHQPESVARARGGQVSLSGQFLPTPVASDSSSNASGGEGGDYLRTVALSLLPTPDTMAHLPARTPEQKLANKGKGGYSNLRETVVNDLPVLLGAPRTSSANGSTTSQRVAGATKGRLEDRVEGARDGYIDWGKFAPAIRRWEIVTGTVAPAPTLPDGKDGTHRLSAAFTEWMMGLPEGWITSVGLRRNEELKACGNGVVPQQAAMAIRHLLGRLADA